MRRFGATLLLLLAGTLPLGGCENGGMSNQQTAMLLGAGGGALVGGLSGRVIGGNATGAAVGALVGALAGGFAGSLIGQNLDERDRARAQQATATVLAEPVPVPPAVKPGQPYAPPRNRAPQASWRSERNPAQGSATLVSVDRTARGGECRTVREVAYIGGKEVVQNSRYCEGGNGQWQQAT